MWSEAQLRAALAGNGELQVEGLADTAVSAPPARTTARPDWTAELLRQIGLVGLPEPATELRFHPVREWRFDLAWEGQRLAVEVEGGIWMQGRHTRGKGFEEDCLKYGEAMVLGWRVLRITPGMIDRGTAVDLLQRILGCQNQ